jgi:hypothetical protein
MRPKTAYPKNCIYFDIKDFIPNEGDNLKLK